MNKRSEFIKKWFLGLASNILYGIIAIVCGLLLAIFGLGVFDILIWVIGIVVIIFGICKIYPKISLYRNHQATPFSIIRDCFPIITGIMLMVLKAGILSSLINIAGIAICAWSIYRLIKLFSHTPVNKEFWRELVISCILLASAAVALLFKDIAEMLCGIVLILLGIELIRVHIYNKKVKNDTKNIYDTDFRDVTNRDNNGKNS